VLPGIGDWDKRRPKASKRPTRPLSEGPTKKWAGVAEAITGRARALLLFHKPSEPERGALLPGAACCEIFGTLRAFRQSTGMENRAIPPRDCRGPVIKLGPRAHPGAEMSAWPKKKHNRMPGYSRLLERRSVLAASDEKKSECGNL